MTSESPPTIRLERYSRSHRQLTYTATVGRLAFTTSFWYEDVDLLALERRYGTPFIERLYLHIIAFDLNRLVSFAPDAVDFGPLTGHVDEDFATLWSEITHGIWGQWRYENDLPDYAVPTMVRPARCAEGTSAGPVDLSVGGVPNLVFCGGGKDSLLAMKVMELAGHPFDTLGYSHSIYGRARTQHALIEKLTTFAASGRHHRLSMYDDLMDSPVLDAEPGLLTTTLIAGETPTSLFAALPIALAHGYRSFVLAHEKSADVGNLLWNATGESVNHQWGKSLAAESLLGDYVDANLIRGFSYFSILKPLQDAVIFPSLGAFLDAVPSTHSCNVQKPWCKRCPKCAYVWLNYQAVLPEGVVDPVFGENLFDVPENLIWFRQLLGLADHTPFECVGQVEESRLAFELCRRKGLTGLAMDLYHREVTPKPVWADVEPLFDIADNPDRIPARLRRGVREVLLRLASEAADMARNALARPINDR